MIFKLSQPSTQQLQVLKSQDLCKRVCRKIKEVKTRDVLIGSGGFLVMVWLDICLGPQLLYRSIDKTRVYWLNKKIDLEEMSEEGKKAALDKALARCAFPENLLPYFKASSSLEKTEKEQVDEICENLHELLFEKGWSQEKVDLYSRDFYQKRLRHQRKNAEEYFSAESGKSFRFSLAALLNYWSLLIVKAPHFVKFGASHTKGMLAGPFLSPVRTAMGFYAYQNLISTLYEILIKLELVDKKASWFKKIEKLSKNLSLESELFFLKKDRSVRYAVMQLLIPFLFIYALRLSQDSLYVQGMQKKKLLENRSFSLHISKNELQGLDENGKKQLEAFFQSRSQVAYLSGSYKELLMGALKDYESLKEVESLVGRGGGSRFFCLAPDKITLDKSKEAYLKKLKEEVSKSKGKQALALVIDPLSWEFLKKDDAFKKFLKGVEGQNLKIVFVGDEKKAHFEGVNEYFPDNYHLDKPSAALEISLALPLGKMLEKYFKHHPMAAALTEFRDLDYLEKSFLTHLKANKKPVDADSIEIAIGEICTWIEEQKKKSLERKSAETLKKIQYLSRQVEEVEKQKRLKLFKKLRSKDFLVVDEDTGQLKYKKRQQEGEVSELILQRLKARREGLQRD